MLLGVHTTRPPDSWTVADTGMPNMLPFKIAALPVVGTDVNCRMLKHEPGWLGAGLGAGPGV
jgi:hypothetical protein